MTAAKELYTLRDVRRVFGDREVLSIPDLRLEAGRIYGLLGPNGAGKTTLMRILSFMDTPTEGEIVFAGELVRPEQAARHRARVVWVPQSPVLFTGTVLYNIEYPLRLKGVKRGERRERAMALLGSVGLTHLAVSPAHRLSGGEAQRASIARALAAGAEVILFDEPTGSVDFRSRAEIIALIGDLWRDRGLSIIVTTHDFELAAELCQERITLFDGKVVSRYPGREEASGIPLGLSAVPGRLWRSDRGTVVAFDQKVVSMPDVPVREAVVQGLAASAAGVTLRLWFAPGRTADVFITGADDITLAGRLTLGESIEVERDAIFDPAIR